MRLYQYHLGPEKELVRKLKPILGFTPVKVQHYKRAILHKSLNVNFNGYQYSNERLEYLGDSILSTIVAEYLFKKYPTRDEGFLTKMRSKIVKRKTLNEIGTMMGLDLLISEYSHGNLSNSMVGNALEAIVGAIYLESGYANTRDYIIKHILMKYINVEDLERIDDNHKSVLLEWSQKNNKEINFVLLSKQKHQKRDYFSVGVNLDGIEIAKAQDYNKKSAEQMAAHQAIDILKIG